MTSDLTVLRALGDELRHERRTTAPNPWAQSPFEWLRNEAPSRKGAIGKEMFKRWAKSAGLSVSAVPPNAHGDCTVAGLTVAIKFGLLWANGRFVFEQIRFQDYDVGALLGIEPHDVHLWIVPRDVLWAESKPQHGAETHWLGFRPSHPPAVLAPFGRTLAAARASLLEQAGDKFTG